MKYIKLYEFFDFEETWIDEPNQNIEVGDNILITDKLKDYIEDRDWDFKMYQLIGKKFKVKEVDSQYPLTIGCYKIIVDKNFWFIPKDCVEKIVNEKFEDDFEEVWEEDDPIELNMKKIKDLKVGDFLIARKDFYMDDRTKFLNRNDEYEIKDIRFPWFEIETLESSNHLFTITHLKEFFYVIGNL